ncbi:MAG: TetR/AcrR family transcriptional regulator [Novosphingobium sp.]|nr:TetR/AcrR family transcriptional regulator [Novosphingobium sp.]MCP5403172.1 TetR/AcrR family transcriptional regulator [Novosphingobium sp.]
MRVKTDARRTAIVAAAWRAFRRNGFERTTMSDIVAIAGGSKATIYNYFESKDELFAAALDHGLRNASEAPFRELAGQGSLEDRLLRFARSDLKIRLSPDMTAVERILVAEGGRSHVYAALREKSLLKRRKIAELLEPEMAAGRLRDADPIRAAIHLLGLIEADLVSRHLQGDKTITPGMLEEQVHQGVEAFLRAYAPAPAVVP